MATLKELLTKHGVENATLESEINVLITSAGSQNSGIPKDRFDKVIGERNQLRADVSELEATIAEMKGSVETTNSELTRLKGIETEYTTLKEAGNKAELEKWNKRKKILEVDETSPDWDKVQKVLHKFNIGDDLTPDQVRANNNLFETYEEVDYFAKDDKEYPDGKKPGKTKQPKTNPFDLKDGVKGAFRDMAECIRITREDPALAKKLADEAKDFKE